MSEPTSVTVTDHIELKDPTGRRLGTFVPDGLGKLPPGVKSPFTDEQLVELRKQPPGRPLADILRDLEARDGGHSSRSLARPTVDDRATGIG